MNEEKYEIEKQLCHPYEGGINCFEIEHEYIMEEICQANSEDLTNIREEQPGLETKTD